MICLFNYRAKEKKAILALFSKGELRILFQMKKKCKIVLIISHRQHHTDDMAKYKTQSKEKNWQQPIRLKQEQIMSIVSELCLNIITFNIT